MANHDKPCGVRISTHLRQRLLLETKHRGHDYMSHTMRELMEERLNELEEEREKAREKGIFRHIFRKKLKGKEPLTPPVDS